MTRRSFVSLAAAAPALAQSRAGSAEKPNFLLILTDQQTHDAWSGAGNPWLKTPAMDSIATNGVAFSQAHCPYPVCSPSRSGIFTGRMPHETGVMQNGLPIASGMPTLGEIFRDAGYKTVYGGKWHLPKSFSGMTGFEQIAGGHALGSRMDAPLADACCTWLEKSAAEPFLLVASFMNPHDICTWIREHPGHRDDLLTHGFPPAPGNMAVDPNEPDAIRYHRTAGYDLMSKAVGIASDWQRDDIRLYIHDYYRMVEAVDWQIGRVLAVLRDKGLDRNTIIAFASDHGEGLGAHLWAQKGAFWEETVRVPMLWSGPGIAPGQRSQELVNLTDILPTFCDYAGLKPPADCRGVSLRPALERRSLDRNFVVSELAYGNDREGRMIRTPRYKYVCFNSGQRREQLFDLEKDPGEQRNLATEAQAKDLLAEQRRLLGGWLKQTNDRFALPS